MPDDAKNHGTPETVPPSVLPPRDQSHIARIRAVARTAHAIGREHAGIILRRLWAWRIIDHRIVRYQLGVSRSSGYRLLGRLRRRGLIQPVLVSGTPAHPWMLTTAGADTITPHMDPDDVRVAPVTTPDHIHVGRVPHDLLTQLFAIVLRDPPTQIRRIIDGCIANTRDEVSYPLPPMEIDMYSAAWLVATNTRLGGHKIPDAIVDYVVDRSSDARVRVAIETQQTVEGAAARERTVAYYCQALADREIDAVVWASTRPTIPPTYTAAASHTLRRWTRTSSRHWVVVPGPGPYREWMTGRLLQLSAPELESAYYHDVI